MTNREYQDRWHLIALEKRSEAGIEGLSCRKEDMDRADRRTLAAFMVEIYANHWRPHYECLGIELIDLRDVLEARAIEIHHWHPDVVRGFDVDVLVQALAEDFRHLPVPQEAAQVILRRTDDLPEREAIAARYDANYPRQD